jgi:hypothetical protein
MLLPSTSLLTALPSLQGLCLTVPDGAAANKVFEETLALPRSPVSGPCIRFNAGRSWIEVRTTSTATALHWQIDDLDAQRLHLQHIGVEVLQDMPTDSTSYLRIEAVETGACVIEFHEQRRTASDETVVVPAPGCLVGIGMQVRAPERVSAHWARIFQLPVQREAGGTPCLQAGDVTLRFTPSEADGIGVQALSFCANDASASFDAAGLHFHLLAGYRVPVARA